MPRNLQYFSNPMEHMCFDAAGGEGEGGEGAGGEGGGAAGALNPGGEGAGNEGGEGFKSPWSGSEGVYKVGEGDDAKNWWDGITEEPIRAYMDEKQYATPDDAARAAWNANLMNKGKDFIQMPGEDATPEQMGEFYNKLGRPDKPEGYEFKFEEGTPVDEKMMEFGKGLFHELGATPKAAQAAADKWNAFVAEMNTGSLDNDRANNEAELTALEQKYEGEGKLNEMRAAGQRVVKTLGLDNAAIEAIEAKIGSAAIVDLLARIGSATPEGTFKGGEGGSGDPNDPANMTKDQASAAVTKLQGDAEFQKAYTDKAHPQHADAVKRMETLFSKAN